MVADKLVEVLLHDGRAQWVLVHIEVQAQRDATIARRVLDYNYRIFNEYEQPVASLAQLEEWSDALQGAESLKQVFK